MKVDVNKIEVEKKYLGGMSFETHSTREYSYTITNTELKGVVIRASSTTKRINQFEFGKTKSAFWIEGKESVRYESVKDLISALIEA